MLYYMLYAPSCILFLFFCIDTAGRDAKKQIESKNKKLDTKKLNKAALGIRSFAPISSF